jgi:ABC-2 type transport system permease protein
VDRIQLQVHRHRLEGIAEEMGEVLQRTAVLAVPALASLVLGIAVGGSMIGSAPIVHTVVFVLSTGLLILTYVSLSVGLSAFVNSSSLATALAVFYFIAFELMWEVVGFILLFVLDLSQNGSFYYVFTHIPPSNASNAVTGVLVSALTDVPSQAASGSDLAAAGSDALLMTPLIGFVILAFWLVVPAALGYWRFKNTDL